MDNPERTKTGLPMRILFRWSGVLTLSMGVAACGPAGSGELDETTSSVSQALGSLAGVAWTAQGGSPVLHGLATNLAPNNAISGAVHVALPHPTNVNTLFAGTVNGGIWRTTNATAASPTWTPLTDFQPSLSTSGLEFDPANAQVLLAGTGSLSSLGAHGTEAGLLISRDGGNTWTQIPDSQISAAGLTVGTAFSSVAIRGNTLLVNSFPFGGVFRSTNGGTSWTRISGATGTGLPEGNEVKDIAGDPTNASRFYLSIFNQGVFISANTGATWTKISQNNTALEAAMHSDSASFLINCDMAVGNNGRAFIAIGRKSFSTGEELLNSVFFTNNQGASWTQMNLPVPKFFMAGIHFSMAVDTVNPNLVYIGGEPSEQRFRGDSSVPITGQQWTAISDISPSGSAPHPDARSMAMNANGDLVEGNDGGIVLRATPRGAGNWRGLNGNLQTLEIHDVAYDSNFDLLSAGTQDNGVPVQTSPGNRTWDSLFLGDGGDVQVDATVPGTSILYSSGPLVRVTYGSSGPISGTQAGIGNTPAPGSPPLQVQFTTPLELHRTDPRRLVIGGANFIYESFDRGDTVTSLGRGAFSHALAYGNPDNPNVLYAAMVNSGGADNGQVLVRLTAGGALVPTAAPFPTGDATDVVIDPRNFQKAFVIGQRNVFVTSNAGASWGSAITGNLQSALSAGVLYSVEFIRATPENILLVGADRGVFATSADTPGAWQEVGTTLPNAPVFDLQHNRRDDVIASGLLGRSAWTATGVAANLAPVALCRDVTVDAGTSCTASVPSSAVNNGSFDPNGDAFTCVLSPPGPFGLGANAVALVCTDSKGAFGSCAATVQVGASAPAWNATTTYHAGDRVTFQGTVFEARQTNTGYPPTPPNSSPPDTNLALWDIPTPCGITPWLDETHYQVGSMVTFAGQTYVCRTDHVAVFNWTPNATPSLWRLATQGDQPICPCP